MKTIVAILISSLVSGCASQAMSEYERLAALPSPASWAPNSVWTLAVVDTKSRLINSMTVRLTEEKAESCTSGDWRRADVLAQMPAPHPEFQGIAAYRLTGRAFVMDLTANICDINNELSGELTEIGVSGSYWSGGPWGGTLIGKFYGVIVPASASPPNKPLHATAQSGARER